MKKRLTHQEEFQVMLLVLDKFLWFGFGLMAMGLFYMFQADINNGISLIIAGAVVLMIFLYLIVKEYEIIKY